MNCQVIEAAAVAKIKDRCEGKEGKRSPRPMAGSPWGHWGRSILHHLKGTHWTWSPTEKGARWKRLGTAGCLLRGFGSFAFSISIKNSNFKAKAPGKLASQEEWTLNLEHLETWLLASNLSLILTSPLTSLCFLLCHVERQNPPISGFYVICTKWMKGISRSNC